jgi:hypothetical protein
MIKVPSALTLYIRLVDRLAACCAPLSNPCHLLDRSYTMMRVAFSCVNCVIVSVVHAHVAELGRANAGGVSPRLSGKYWLDLFGEWLSHGPPLRQAWAGRGLTTSIPDDTCGS